MNSKTNKVHRIPPYFPTEDNCLTVGGIKLTNLVEKIGQTPFYVYDSSIIKERITYIKETLPAEIHLHYAIKANPMTDVVNFIQPNVDGLDVASSKELDIALQTGIDAHNISFAGPGKRNEELSHAISSGITINVESLNELESIARISHAINKTARVAIRVNPDFELKTSGMKMSGGPKQFGIDAELVPSVLRRVAKLDVEFVGFHIFSGSQNLLVDSIKEAQSKTVELACELAKSCAEPVKSLNLGGGFGIPYFPGENTLNLHPIGKHLEKLIPVIRKEMREAEIIIELGRFIIGEAGLYVSKIIDRKISRGQVFLITDGGLHHHLAASGNFGQVVRKNYPVKIGNIYEASNKEIVTIVGPLCTPLDILADRMELPKADINDLVVVFQSGAYGCSASPHNFLSHPHPKEIMV